MSGICGLLRLALVDLAHALLRPCRRGRSRKLPARGLRIFLLKLLGALGVIALLAMILFMVTWMGDGTGSDIGGI